MLSRRLLFVALISSSFAHAAEANPNPPEFAECIVRLKDTALERVVRRER